jgi:calcineurin-like phosphoesterase family protein
MDATMIRNWNEIVRPEDIIYIIGDFIWRGGKGYKKHIIDQLYGQKIFILGNHDGKTEQPKSYLGLGFKEVYSCHTTININECEVLLSHYPYNPMLSQWQRFVYKLKNFWKFWRRDKYPLFKHMEKRPINRGGWLLCGHIHDAWKTKGRMINVGVDVWGFTPVPITEIEKMIKDHPDGFPAY